MHKSCYLCVTIIVFTDCVIGQSITIFDHRQEDSKTLCENGLISDVDTVVFKCEINYSQDRSMKYAHFYIKKKTDQVPLFYADLNIQECISSVKVTCDRAELFVIHTSINVPASTDYNGAVINAKLLKSNGMEVPSNKMYFPQIVTNENANTSGSLFINGKEVSTKLTNCSITINQPTVNIAFVCQSFLKPCLIEITAQGMGQSSHGENNKTLSLEQIPEDLHVLIKYASCTFKSKYNEINCTIYTEKAKNGMDTVVNIAVSVAAVVVTAILVLLCLIKRKEIKSVFLEIKCKENNYLDTSDTASPQKWPLVWKTSQYYRSKYLCKIKCEKNPSHRKFYAINDFQKHYIHRDFQDDEIVSLIKLTADLTTLICVKFTSEKRPSINPVGTGMVLKYVIADKKAPRNKTGMVIAVTEYQDNSKCSCRNCKISKNQSKKIRSVFVLTSSTVVYDDSEAEKSSFCLFYDTSESHVTTIYGARVHKINHDEGWCIVECVTSDLQLVENLSSMIKNCQDQMEKVNKKYCDRNHMRSFTFIVAHPHGSTKHVTFGYWKDREVVPAEGNIIRTRYKYTTRTCPGSAGAFVYIIGVSDFKKERYHVHISYEAERCNYCSIGVETLPENNK